MKSIKTSFFSLENTMESGQFFLYSKTADHTYHIIHRNLVFQVKQEACTLYFEHISAEALCHFFSLDMDYSTLVKRFKDPLVKKAVHTFPGLRLIRQDLWQCMMGFVLSSASNIPRIRRSMETIVQQFGETPISNPKGPLRFPEPGSIQDVNKLSRAKTGYRQKYILEINRHIRNNPSYLNQLAALPYNLARKSLCELPGIGEKIADCIALFALGHLDAFPLDTWMLKGLDRHYFSNQRQTKNQYREFIADTFHEYPGIQQQFLYHYWRSRGFNLQD